MFHSQVPVEKIIVQEVPVYIDKVVAVTEIKEVLVDREVFGKKAWHDFAERTRICCGSNVCLFTQIDALVFC